MKETRVPFSELDSEIQDAYLVEAFNGLVNSGAYVPYGYITGDDGTYHDWEPAWRLAEENYEQA